MDASSRDEEWEIDMKFKKPQDAMLYLIKCFAEWLNCVMEKRLRDKEK